MNSETYPASLFPLRGDVSAEAGDILVTVVGVRGIPVTAILPKNGQGLSYNSTNNDLEWGAGSGVIQCDGVGVSSDYLILVDCAFVIKYGSDDFLGIRADGVLVDN